MARTGNVRYVRRVGGNLQGTRTSDQRLSGITIDRDYVGALRGVADQAGAVLVRSVLMEWNRQEGNQQRTKAHESR